jgi:hypothetical protein
VLKEGLIAASLTALMICFSRELAQHAAVAVSSRSRSSSIILLGALGRH